MKRKETTKLVIAFVIGAMLVVGLQAYQQSQLDQELFNSPYRMTVRLVARHSGFEWEDSVTISIYDEDGDIAEKLTLSKPPSAEARQSQSALGMDRFQWSTYSMKVEGPNFDTFTFRVNAFAFEENDPWQISSSIKLLYDDWTSNLQFIIWIGLGY